MHTAEYWVHHLGLHEHPEGGFFREVYRAWDAVSAAALPQRYTGDRNICTSIYYLLRSHEVSRFHRLASDEIWHFYTGSPLTLHLLQERTGYRNILIGPDVAHGYQFQATIPAGVWFGATVDEKDSFTLVGCTVAPGFEFDDFELAGRGALLRDYPGHRDIIVMLT